MKQVIALSGYKGSGKDTAAAYLVENYGFQRIAFADVLKDLVSTQYNVPREDMDHPIRKEEPILHLPVIPTDPFTIAIQGRLASELSQGFWTPRALCILEGSVKRSVHSNYWVQRAIGPILSAQTGKFVITDMRYRSEADVLNMLIPGVEFWRINRYLNINTTDPSERDLDGFGGFTCHISNLGSIPDFEMALGQLMSHRMTPLQKRSYDAWGTYIP